MTSQVRNAIAGVVEGRANLREALLMADHNAYHLGVLAVMARIVKANP